MRRIFLVLIVMLTAACAGTGGTPSSAQGPEGLLLVEAPHAVGAFDTASGSNAWTDKGGLFSPDFDRVFRIEGGELVVTDPGSGDDLGSVKVPQGFVPRVASTSGRLAALVEGPAGGTPYEPVERSETRIIVGDPQAGDVYRFELSGNFEPEAFSVDDRSIFLIEYLPATDLKRYRVRVMDLRTGRIAPAGRLTKAAPDSMKRIGRTQTYSPDGEFLYTLYTRQPPNTAHRDHWHNEGSVHAFVHVLNLKKAWAHCIDLPMPFGMGTEPANVLAASPDGSSVFVGDGRRLARIDTAGLRFAEMEDVGAYAAEDAHAVADDRGRLYVGSGETVTVFQGDPLALVDTWTSEGAVSSLGLADDGTLLFLGTPDGVSVVSTRTGEETSTIDAPGADRIRYSASS